MVNCSPGTARTAIVHSYKHGLNGFSALLTETEAAQISGNSLSFQMTLKHLLAHRDTSRVVTVRLMST
jgi:hypothetical protein